jgi:hypothetical protein
MWATEKPALPAIPDSHKWMYRAARSVVQITRNGVRITQGSGRSQLCYSYDNPAILEVWRGRQVAVFWNDSNPDTDACVFTIKAGRPHKFLCVAKRVREIPRLGASEEESSAEATRKKLHSQLAVSKSGNLAQYLQRGVRNAECGVGKDQLEVGKVIEKAREAADQVIEQQARNRMAVRSVEVTAEDLEAATQVGSAECGVRNAEMTAEELSELI